MGRRKIITRQNKPKKPTKCPRFLTLGDHSFPAQAVTSVLVDAGFNHSTIYVKYYSDRIASMSFDTLVDAQRRHKEIVELLNLL